MIKDVLKPMSEVGLPNEALQKKNCMQNGRRYQQRRWPERLSVETRPVPLKHCNMKHF